MIAKSSETPFEANIVLLCIFVLDKFVVLFVDGVVCQVHIPIVFIELSGIALRCKAGKTFLVNIDSQWFVACDYYVDSQVKFVTIDEKWICHIAGDN